MGELVDFGQRLSNLTDSASLARIVAKAGAAGKKSALDAAAKDLGGDRRFSGMRRSAALTVGYDAAGSKVQLNFRGPWKLAEEGRRSSGPILPKRRGGRRAVLTPQGPRARSSYKRAPRTAKRTYTDAVRDAQREVPKAAAEQFRVEIRKVVRG